MNNDFTHQNNLLKTLGEKTCRFKLNSNGEGYLDGKRGQIHPYSNDGTYFTMYLQGRQRIGRALMLPWAIEHQTGDDEAYIMFHRKYFPKAKRVIGAKKKKQPSQEEIARLKSIGFKKGTL